jgi:hypothetical protein
MKRVGVGIAVLGAGLVAWFSARPQRDPVVAPPAVTEAPAASGDAGPAAPSAPPAAVEPGEARINAATRRAAVIDAAALRALDGALEKAEADGADPTTIAGLRARRALLANPPEPDAPAR